MAVLAILVGSCLAALVLVDAFNTVVLARRTRHVFRIARLYYRITWSPFAAIAKRVASPLRREGFLGIYGPLSLLFLFGLWAVGLTIAFALLHWAAGLRPTSLPASFGNDLYISATTLFTLAHGDPQNAVSKWIVSVEAGLGLAFLGLVVGYLPVLYQAFSVRELPICMLDARAGSPPSAGRLVESVPTNPETLGRQLEAWEYWEAQVLESQLSFPMLAYFRSHHPNQAWLTALVAITDFAAVVSVAAAGDLRAQAEKTFAMGRHVLADITVEFGLENESDKAERAERLPQTKFAVLLERVRGRVSLFDEKRFVWQELARRREIYEPHAIALSHYFLMSLPDWLGDEASRSNWDVPLSDREEAPFAVSDPFIKRE